MVFPLLFLSSILFWKMKIKTFFFNFFLTLKENVISSVVIVEFNWKIVITTLYSISTEFIPLASPYRTATNHHFSKIPVLLKVTFFAHRCMQRYLEKYAVTSIVTLICKGKFDRYTDRYRYYHYRTLKNNASRAS